jgi:solute carrier family 25 folate transporter 32
MTQPATYNSSTPYYYKSVRNALIEIPRKEGWKALFKGLGPSMMGVGNVAIQFPLYEKIKSQQSKYPTIDSWKFILFASSISKIIASGFTYPHEVVRTRLQTQSSIASAETIYTGVMQTIGVVYRNEGIRGFYRGYLLGLLRTVPASALTIFTFEYVNWFLQSQKK